MTVKTFSRSAAYVLAGTLLVWGVVLLNNVIYPVLARRAWHVHPYVNDLFSDAVLLLAALLPAVAAPKFFGYQQIRWQTHARMLLGMAVFFIAAPLLYRLFVGATPFGANTWFFEGIVVPVAEEGFFRGVLFSLLLWGFTRLYPENSAGWLALIFSTLLFSTAHLNNLGSYPTSFILFQAGFSTIVGFAFGYTRLKTGSVYPAMVLHALFNLAGTL